MKRNVLYVCASLLGCVMVLSGFNLAETLEDKGAPSKYTGSPGDGRNCTSCHKGSQAQSMSDLISSDIPAEGYTPGETYSIVAKISKSGHKRFGFQISPQDRNGNLLGTLINMGSQTKLTGSQKYITHTLSGISGTDEKSWEFNWTAPKEGTGAVTFYGAFIAANSDGKDDGDLTYLSSLEIQERIVDGINENISDKSILHVFPNPTKESVNIEFTVKSAENLEINLLDIEGRKVQELLSEKRNPGQYNETFDLNKDLKEGVYFLQLRSSSLNKVNQIIIEK